MKVTYINGICISHDAISNCVADEIRALSLCGHDVRLYAYDCDRDWIAFERVSNLSHIARSHHFLESDLVVFHFGIYYPLFNLLPLVPKSAKSLVVFHNITPAALAPEHSRPLIERSFAQMHNISWAHHVACDSPTNLEVLRDAGITTPGCVLPLSFHGNVSAPAGKASFNDGVVRIAFVGRFVKSKGPAEAIQVVLRILDRSPQLAIQFDLIGNTTFSDVDVLSHIQAAILSAADRYGERAKIVIRASIDDDAKHDILRAADIFLLPSYHEGFCVPVLEALASGCVVVTYDNSNLPAVAGGLGMLVETGNVEALHDAVHASVGQVSSPTWQRGGYGAYVESTRIHLQQFSSARVSRNFNKLIRRLFAEEPNMKSRAEICSAVQR